MVALTSGMLVSERAEGFKGPNSSTMLLILPTSLPVAKLTHQHLNGHLLITASSFLLVLLSTKISLFPDFHPGKVLLSAPWCVITFPKKAQHIPFLRSSCSGSQGTCISSLIELLLHCNCLYPSVSSSRSQVPSTPRQIFPPRNLQPKFFRKLIYVT